jgi:hypothetical protein
MKIDYGAIFQTLSAYAALGLSAYSTWSVRRGREDLITFEVERGIDWTRIAGGNEWDKATNDPNDPGKLILTGRVTNKTARAIYVRKFDYSQLPLRPVFHESPSGEVGIGKTRSFSMTLQADWSRWRQLSRSPSLSVVIDRRERFFSAVRRYARIEIKFKNDKPSAM